MREHRGRHERKGDGAENDRDFRAPACSSLQGSPPPLCVVAGPDRVNARRVRHPMRVTFRWNRGRRTIALVSHDTPLFAFNRSRSTIVDEVVRRVAAGVRDPVLLLNEAAYLETAAQGGGIQRADLAEWRTLARSAGADDQRGATRTASSADAGATRGMSPGISIRASTRIVTRLGRRSSARSSRRGDPQEPAARLRSDGARRAHPRAGAARAHPAARARSGRWSSCRRTCRTSTRSSSASRIERAGLPPATYGAGQEPLHEPGPHATSCTTSARTASTAGSGTRLYKDVLKTYSCVLHRARVSLALLPRRHALALGRRRAAAQARARGDGHRGVRAHDRRGTHAARVLRAGDDQLPAHARGRDAHRRLPLGGGEGIATSSRTTNRRASAASRRSRTSCSGSTARCVIRFCAAARLLRQLRRRRGASATTRAAASVDAASYVMGRDGKPALDAVRDARVHARARRA